MFMLYNKKWDKELKPELNPVQQTLLKMAEVLEQRGWCQFRVENKEGALCLFGSLRVAVYGSVFNWNPPTPEAFELFQGVVKRLHEHCGLNITGWNNSIARDKTEVINMLRDLAASE